MLLLRSSQYAALLLSAFPYITTAAAADEPAKIYDLSNVFAESWVNFGSSSSSSASSSSEGKVIMRGVDDGGQFWNRNALPCGNYELGLDLYLNLPDQLTGTNFEGIGIWVIDNTTFGEISDGFLSGSSDRDLFNYRTDYNGYGTFFSILNRKKILKPSISVLFNDGTPLLPKDVPTEFGLYFNFTQNPQIQINMSVKKNHVTTRAKTLKGDWKKISGVSGGSDVCGYLGISSSNKRDLKSGKKNVIRGADLLFVNATLTTTDQNFYYQMLQEANPRLEAGEGQDGVREREVVVEDDLPKLADEGRGEGEADGAADAGASGRNEDGVPSPDGRDKSEVVAAGKAPSTAPVTEEDKLEDNPGPNVQRGGKNKSQSKNLKGGADSMARLNPKAVSLEENPTQPAKDVIQHTEYDHSKMEALLADLHKKFSDFEANHMKINFDLKNLAKVVNAETQKNLNNEIKRDQQTLVRQQRVDALFAEIKDLIKKSGESRAINIADTHKSFEDLQANAASLESTVRMASTYSTYLAAGLFVSFLVFGGVIYKRMKDMEKKHFL